MFVCLYVGMLVHWYICMFVCWYIMIFLVDALYLGRQTLTGPSTTHGRVSSATAVFFEIHPAITLCTINRITLCSYSVQLHATLRVFSSIATAARITSHKARRCYTLLQLPVLRHTRPGVTTRCYSCPYYVTQGQASLHVATAARITSHKARRRYTLLQLPVLRHTRPCVVTRCYSCPYYVTL